MDRSAHSTFPTVAAGLKRFTLLFGLWLILTAGAAGSALPGALAALAATILSLRLQPPGGPAVRLLRLISLAPGFLWRSLLGGIDVAWRALHPRLPIDPGWVRYRLRLPAGAARVALGDELSLMPGSLAAGGHGDTLYIHYLDRSQAGDHRIAAEEQRIGHTIGVTLEDRHD